MFWDTSKYVEFLEKENADLKLQVKKLTDAILLFKGGAPIFSERKPTRPGVGRVSMRDLQGRLERAEAIPIEGRNG